MQEVVCAIEKCGYRSKNGFCLNRVVSIGSNGMCKWINKKDWTKEIAKQFKSTYNPWKWVEEESRGPVEEIPEVDTEETQDQKKDGKDGARVD